MYVPVTESGEPYYHEGFVVRFFRGDGTDWVANFEGGRDGINAAFDFPQYGRVVIIATGQLYVMDPDQERPVAVHGGQIEHVFQAADGALVCGSHTHVFVLSAGGDHIRWTARLALDGLRGLALNGTLLSGEAYWHAGPEREWLPFTVEIRTMKVDGYTWPE
jgi:hypothetical protein